MNKIEVLTEIIDKYNTNLKELGVPSKKLDLRVDLGLSGKGVVDVVLRADRVSIYMRSFVISDEPESFTKCLDKAFQDIFTMFIYNSIDNLHDSALSRRYL